MGEVGIPLHEYYFELKWWELQAIERGYGYRHKEQWSAIRWMTFNVMNTMPYVDLTKAGIYNPTDLLHLPWDRQADGDKESTTPMLSDEEIERMQQMMREENARLNKL